MSSLSAVGDGCVIRLYDHLGRVLLFDSSTGAIVCQHRPYSESDANMVVKLTTSEGWTITPCRATTPVRSDCVFSASQEWHIKDVNPTWYDGQVRLVTSDNTKALSCGGTSTFPTLVSVDKEENVTQHFRVEIVVIPSGSFVALQLAEVKHLYIHVRKDGIFYVPNNATLFHVRRMDPTNALQLFVGFVGETTPMSYSLNNQTSKQDSIVYRGDAWLSTTRLDLWNRKLP
eukprot:PhF_6_TR35493/c0_g1_i2/m.51761